MYLISGTLFFITSFFIFIFNYVSYNDKLNGFISFLAFISLIMGVVFYYIQYSEINTKK